MIDSFIDSLTNNEKHPQSGEYSLDNISKLLESFDNPQNKLNFIHVAGTNGKGSICLMLASIFESAGYNTGLYTSPHLLKVNERIRINKKNISDEDFSYYLNLIKNKIDENSIAPTYFDVMTVVSILYFADENIDIAVMETGLGGRLDSTNIITPLFSVITDISFDHEGILGHTIEEITFEKCGIIKKNIPVVTTNSNKSIIALIQKRCAELNSDFFVYESDFIGENIELSSSEITFDFYDKKNNNRIDSLKIAHPGEFQIKNACAAVFISILLKKEYPLITNAVIYKTLIDLKLKGRFEKISDNPLIFFDPAHNTNAVENIINILEKNWNSFDIHIIFSLMADKNINIITELLSEKFKNLIFYKLDDPRCFSPDEKWKNETGIEIISEKTELAEYIACKNNAHSLFLFTGSFRLYKIAMEIATEI